MVERRCDDSAEEQRCSDFLALDMELAAFVAIWGHHRMKRTCEDSPQSGWSDVQCRPHLFKAENNFASGNCGARWSISRAVEYLRLKVFHPESGR